MTQLHPKIAEVTARIEERSRDSRRDYLARIQAAKDAGPGRQHLSCGNLAHAFAAVPLGDKLTMRGRAPNIGIVTSYNDMLSAHQPFKHYPDIIKDAARKAGALGAGRRRHARHVRWRHAGPARHGAVAVLARCDRALHRRRPHA